MRRILADTGPLVALCDERDGLHGRARAELDRLAPPLAVAVPVLTEACFLLPAPHLRARLAGLFARDLLRLEAPSAPDRILARTFEWLARYAGHHPDLADAWLVCWAEAEPAARVWTFDREFSSLWRTLKGRKVRLSPLR